MMKKLLAVALVLVFVPAVSATVVVSDDFESYGDTAAMQANWGNTGLGNLDAGLGNPSQSAVHPGGTVNSWIGSAFNMAAPSGVDGFQLSADIYDDGTSSNERMTVGLRGGPFPLFEMGHYNGTAGAFYHLRIVNAYGGESWVPLLTGGSVEGWHHYEATFYPNKLVVTIDLGDDGTIDGSYTSLGAGAGGWTDLRFGGPSNLSSAGGGANFDNILLETVDVPEPASLALVALGGLVALRRRR